MAREKVTMTDIARAVGCSQTTVSLVLNDVPNSKISANLRTRVLAAARTLNYRRMPAAENWSGAQPMTIGIITDHITSETSTFADELQMSGEVLVLIAKSTFEKEHLSSACAALSRAGVAGIVILQTSWGIFELPKDLKLSVPVVFYICDVEQDRSETSNAGESVDQKGGTSLRDAAAAAVKLFRASD
jgi:LacI family transcriptional regulator